MAPDLLRAATADKWLNELSFYYLLKLNFANSRIYKIGNTYKRLAEMLNVSDKTIYRRFKALKEQRLITEDGGAYVLKANPKIRYKRVFFTQDEPNEKDLKELLFLTSIQEAGKKQARNDSLAQFIRGEKKESKSRRKSKAGDTYDSFISVRYAARILNVSKSTAAVLFNVWREKGLIESRSQDSEYLFDAGEGIVKHLYGFYGHRYSQDMKLFNVQPSQHSFLLQPVPALSMTLKKYKVLSKFQAIRDLIDKIYSMDKIRTICI